uniref:Helicase C-terminal domain-containing protein n=1 Tax=Eutreptiella gymnastica TaxID=73025 RepID=A0A7S1ICH3_9EUGL
MQHLLQRIVEPLLQAHGHALGQGPPPTDGPPATVPLILEPDSGTWMLEDPRDRHLLLYGPTLMGKSLLIQWAMRRLYELCQERQWPAPPMYWLWGDERRVTPEQLRQILLDARHTPSLVVFDEIWDYTEDPSTTRLLAGLCNRDTHEPCARFIIAATSEDEGDWPTVIERVFTHQHKVETLAKTTVTHIVERAIRSNLRCLLPGGPADAPAWSCEDIRAAGDGALQAEYARRAAEHAQGWTPDRILREVRTVLTMPAGGQRHLVLLREVVRAVPRGPDHPWILEAVERFLRRLCEDDAEAAQERQPYPELLSEDESEEGHEDADWGGQDHGAPPVLTPEGPQVDPIQKACAAAGPVAARTPSVDPGALYASEFEHARRFLPRLLTLHLVAPATGGPGPCPGPEGLADVHAFVPKDRPVAEVLRRFWERGYVAVECAPPTAAPGVKVEAEGVEAEAVEARAPGGPRAVPESAPRGAVTFAVYFCARDEKAWRSCKDDREGLMRLCDRLFRTDAAHQVHLPNWLEHVDRQLGWLGESSSGRAFEGAPPCGDPGSGAGAGILLTARTDAPPPPPGERFHPSMVPHQCRAVAWMRQTQQSHGGGFLCDDCGMGKTFTCLQHLQMDCSEGPPPGGPQQLVVAPMAIVPHWLVEGDKWFPETRASRHWVQPERMIAVCAQWHRARKAHKATIARLTTTVGNTSTSAWGHAGRSGNAKTAFDDSRARVKAETLKWAAEEAELQRAFREAYEEVRRTQVLPYRCLFVDYATLRRIANWNRPGRSPVPIDLFQDLQLTHVLLDEPHKLHSKGTKQIRWNSLEGRRILALPARWRWCVTSTPNKRGPMDLLSMLHFVRAPLASVLQVWFTEPPYHVVPECAIPQFNQLMLRRDPDVVGENLPVLKTHRVSLLPHPGERDLYDVVVHGYSGFYRRQATNWRTQRGVPRAGFLESTRHVSQHILPFFPGLPHQPASKFDSNPCLPMKDHCRHQRLVTFKVGATVISVNPLTGRLPEGAKREYRSRQEYCNQHPLNLMTAHSTKLERLVTILKEKQQAGQKVVVFTASKESAVFAARFVARKCPPPHAVKTVIHTDRDDPKQTFQDNARAVALFVTVTSTCEGLDLHYAQAAVFLDPVLDSAASWQALGRIRRLSLHKGLEKDVYYLHYELPIPKLMTDLQLGADCDLDTKLARVFAKLLEVEATRGGAAPRTIVLPLAEQGCRPRPSGGTCAKRQVKPAPGGTQTNIKRRRLLPVPSP